MTTGAFLRAASAIAVLSLMDAVIKAMAASYPTFQVAFLRFAFGLVVAGAALAAVRPGLPSCETVIANAGRAALTVVTATTFFYRARTAAARRSARPHLPLPDVRRAFRRPDAGRTARRAHSRGARALDFSGCW